MRRDEINIRDPFVLRYLDTYYLYGTRSETCWGPADGFDCYTSRDLEEFEGPFEIFHRPEGFFADTCYWAPECIFLKDAFYLITTFGSTDPNTKKGIYVLKSDSPTGPFIPYSQRLTPAEWTCIDGTVYFEQDTAYLVFSHSLEDNPEGVNGDFCRLKLKHDLSAPDGAPEVMFSAKDAPWARPVPFAKAEFNIEGDAYFSDGPFLIKADDSALYMIFSSWSNGGYAIGAARSESGSIQGPWCLQERPLFPENGGRGMLFKDNRENLLLTLHYPNDKHMEHPCFTPVRVENNELSLAQ